MRLNDTSGRTFLAFCAVVEFSTVSQVPFGRAGTLLQSKGGHIHKHTLTRRVKLCVSYYRYYCQLLLTVNDRARFFFVSSLAVVFILLTFLSSPFFSSSSISFEEPTFP